MYIAVLQWSSRLWCELLQFRVTMLDGCSRGSLPVFKQHWWMNENRIRTHDLWIWRPELYPWTMAPPNGLVTHRELFSVFFWCSDDVMTFFSAGRDLKKGGCRVIYDVVPGYDSIALCCIGKQGSSYNEMETYEEGLENIRAAVASEFLWNVKMGCTGKQNSVQTWNRRHSQIQTYMHLIYLKLPWKIQASVARLLQQSLKTWEKVHYLVFVELVN